MHMYKTMFPVCCRSRVDEEGLKEFESVAGRRVIKWKSDEEGEGNDDSDAICISSDR